MTETVRMELLLAFSDHTWTTEKFDVPVRGDEDYDAAIHRFFKEEILKMRWAKLAVYVVLVGLPEET